MKTPYPKSFFITAGKTIGIFLLLLFSIHCKSPIEPIFNIKGDQNILKDVKVNIEAITDHGIRINSIFYKGKALPLELKDALRYHIYISYKDSLFYMYQTDNLHGKIKGRPINEIVITQQNDGIITLYRVFENSALTGGNRLRPAKDFFANKTGEDHDQSKQKFTVLYEKK